MSTVTATAHPNIALVKYWGKRDVPLNLPAVPSLSLTLDTYRTRTTVTWGTDADHVEIDGVVVPAAPGERVRAFLDRVDPERPPCRVVSESNFPAGAGLASSSSAFAALALAASTAAGHDRSATELSVLARQGSGSACRSLWGGFVEWTLGERADGTDSHGVPIAPADHWDVRMVVCVVSAAKKKVGSTAGMERSRQTCPYYDAWVRTAAADVDEARAAVLARDLGALGAVMERSTFKMHAAMHATVPPLIYWQPATVAAVHAVHRLRDDGVHAWVTMDAGPQVKVLCPPASVDAVREVLQPHAERLDVLCPGGPARVEA